MGNHAELLVDTDVVLDDYEVQDVKVPEVTALISYESSSIAKSSDIIDVSTLDTVDKVLELYNDLNERYGFKVDFDIKDLTSNFKSIVNPNNMKLFELYLSEAFSRIRLIVFQRALLSIATLMEQISNPEVLSSNDYPLEYKYAMMNQLMQLMQNFNNMYADIATDDVDEKLRNLGTKEVNLNDDSLNNPEIVKMMEDLNHISIKDKENEEPE